jgi:hypothetical protein
MMELLAPVLLALLFILFGLSHRGRSPGGCAGCTGEGECKGKASCDRKESEATNS